MLGSCGMHRSPALKVVKKNSPGESCRKRTPCSATGASRKMISSLLYVKQTSTATSAARAPTITRSRSSSRWSHMGICRSLGSSALSGYRNFCTAERSSALSSWDAPSCRLVTAPHGWWSCWCWPSKGMLVSA